MKKQEGKGIIDILEALGVISIASKTDITYKYNKYLDGYIESNKKLDKKIKNLEDNADKSGFEITKKDIDDYFSDKPLSS